MDILDAKTIKYTGIKPYRLCTFSRVTKEKGIEDAVRAVCEINSMHSDIFAELDIYGQIEDNQEEWLKKLQTLAPGYIKYKGMVPFSQSTKVLKEYDALLLPINNGSFLITGATGLIGSCIIDTLLYANVKGANFKIYAMSRSRKKVMEKFGDKVIPVIQDVAQPLGILSKYDYIIHCASNADPKSYAIQPVETILTNILGNKNVLEYCKEYKKCRMLLTSTFEVYGEISNTSVYKENMSGIIDQTVLRNAYPESKRSCELLLRSYVDEYNINAVICRLPSVYGPTMLKSDSKAHGQFIKNALNKENIVLKSKGEQRRTYSYVVDVVSGIFKVLFNGLNGEVYNIANENSIASIAEVASICAEIAGTNVVFDLPDKIEKKGFSQSKDCILDNSKLKSLGWNGKYTLKQGLVETIESLREDE